MLQTALRHECEAESKRYLVKFHAKNPHMASMLNEDKIPNVQENAALVENYMGGLKSSDPVERAKLQEFKDAFVNDKTSLPEIVPALRLFTTAKKLGGRPTVSPGWRAIDVELKQIRTKILKEKLTKAKAVEEVALTTGAIGGGHQNKLDRLRTAYSAKMKLREKT